MEKSQIRKIFKNKRSLLSHSQLEEKSRSITEKVLTKFQITAKTVSIFLPIERYKEVNTFFLIDELLKNENIMCIPKSNFKLNTLEHIAYNDQTILETNQYGIPEPKFGKEIAPKDMDIVFVPLLAVDQDGFRVGYGKGFYDRFLADCSENTLFIGLNYFEPIDWIQDINSNDIPIHYLVTPSKIVRFVK